MIRGFATMEKDISGPSSVVISADAARQGVTEVLKLSSGSDLTTPDDLRLGLLPLHWAILNGQSDAVQFLMTQEGMGPALATRGLVLPQKLTASVSALALAQYAAEVVGSTASADILQQMRDHR